MSLPVLMTSQAVSENPSVPLVTVTVPNDYTYLAVPYFYCQVFLISPIFYMSLYNAIRMFVGGFYKDIRGINRILLFAIATEPIRLFLDMLVLPASANAAILMTSRLFRIINLSTVNYYTVKRAFSILPASVLPVEHKPNVLRSYVVVLASLSIAYFILNIVQFTDKTLVPLSWYNPFRTGYTIVVLASGITCNFFFMTTLLNTITLGLSLDLANVLLYLLPIGTMLYYVIEKFLGFANYNYIDGYSMPLDECNNLAFLSITVDLYLIFGVLEHLRSKSGSNPTQSESRRNSNMPTTSLLRRQGSTKH